MSFFVEKGQDVGKNFTYFHNTMGYIISKTKELKTYVRIFRGGSVEIVASDKIGQGKRIKIGDVIIIGTKQPETTSNTVDIKNRC